MAIEIKRIHTITPMIRQALNLYLNQNKISRSFPLDQGRIETMLEKMTKHPAYGLWIAFNGEMPVGFVSGQLQESLFHDRVFAFDLGWFVLPDYQGKGLGRRLLDTYIGWAKDNEASVVHFCVAFADEDSDRRNADKLKAMGFEPWGQLTRKVLETEGG
ncbi:hypothetical protein GZ77_23400 [Endozoicomonas montiporae]|uniref:N-acetyltransferase domain-containing protein n=1 Tax=Endozoicomonas montiporae TaxID=1027273 RepID=A0A081N0Q9_9GAMM|nr:GNAT family N-acetyltransferase [Endozoicomonas montiporae]KEQ12032.1 hypothetical protein GZ77_23400 [Endozoicomonas montiporae]